MRARPASILNRASQHSQRRTLKNRLVRGWRCVEFREMVARPVTVSLNETHCVESEKKRESGEEVEKEQALGSQ